MADGNIPKIYASMVEVAKKIEAIGKAQRNTIQNFNFRGIDDVYNSLHSLLADENIVMRSKIIEMSREERSTKAGAHLIYTKLLVEYTFFCAIDGSFIETTVPGEGMDSGDKSAAKAMSAAHKTALIQTFTIPTKDLDDGDKDSYQVAAPVKINPSPIKPVSVKTQPQKIPHSVAGDFNEDIPF